MLATGVIIGGARANEVTCRAMVVMRDAKGREAFSLARHVGPASSRAEPETGGGPVRRHPAWQSLLLKVTARSL